MISSEKPQVWGQALRDPTIRLCVMESWRSAFVEDSSALFNGEMASLQALMERLLVSLAESLPSEPPWDPTSPELRDTVKVVSVIGGWLRETHHPISTALLLFRHFEKAVFENHETGPEQEISALMWALACAASESYLLTAREQRTEEHQEFLRKSTPLVFIKEDLPALIFLGAPRPDVLEELLERLHVATVRRDAPHVLLEFTGVPQPAASLSAGVLSLRARSGMASRIIHIVAASPRVDEALREEGIVEPGFPRHDSLEEALNALSGRETAPF